MERLVWMIQLKKDPVHKKIMHTCAHTLVAQNCSRHDFENLTKFIRSSSVLNQSYIKKPTRTLLCHLDSRRTIGLYSMPPFTPFGSNTVIHDDTLASLSAERRPTSKRDTASFSLQTQKMVSRNSLSLDPSPRTSWQAYRAYDTGDEAAPYTSMPL